LYVLMLRLSLMFCPCVYAGICPCLQNLTKTFCLNSVTILVTVFQLITLT